MGAPGSNHPGSIVLMGRNFLWVYLTCIRINLSARDRSYPGRFVQIKTFRFDVFQLLSPGSSQIPLACATDPAERQRGKKFAIGWCSLGRCIIGGWTLLCRAAVQLQPQCGLLGVVWLCRVTFELQGGVKLSKKEEVSKRKTGCKFSAIMDPGQGAPSSPDAQRAHETNSSVVTPHDTGQEVSDWDYTTTFPQPPGVGGEQPPSGIHISSAPLGTASRLGITSAAIHLEEIQEVPETSPTAAGKFRSYKCTRLLCHARC
eukprot:2513142-Rhodomonas_salina.1